MSSSVNNELNKACCTPRIREQYGKQYTFGVDREIHNFPNCGYIYYQKFPPMCARSIHKDCHCNRNYYDPKPQACEEHIRKYAALEKELQKQMPKFLNIDLPDGDGPSKEEIELEKEAEAETANEEEARRRMLRNIRHRHRI